MLSLEKQVELSAKGQQLRMFFMYCTFSSSVLAEIHVPCPKIVETMGGSLIRLDAIYRAYIGQFGAPKEAVDAAMTVKSCVNKISFTKRLLIGDVLVIHFFILCRA